MRTLQEKQLFESGKEAFDQKRYAEAQNLFQEAILHNARHVDSYFYLANIFHLSGQVSKAILAFEKVLELVPEHTDAAIGLSVLLNDIGQYERAKEIFERADKRVRDHKGDRSERSEEGSGPRFHDTHINKKFSFKHFELAELYLTHDRYDEALFEYGKALRLDPSLKEARIQVSKVYAKKGLTSKAIEELQKLKSEDPHYLAARVALGVLYYSNGHVVEAQNEWTKVLTRDPGHPDAKMYLELSQDATETRIR